MLRLTLRRLIGEPAFTTTVLFTLALCIAANVAIFAVVDAILVRSLPLPEPGRLVTIVNGYPGAGVARAAASMANYFERREALRSYSSLSLIQDGAITIGSAGSPHRVPIARVTPEFFDTLKVGLALGHPFTNEHFTYGADQVAILTDDFWRIHFNADPDVIGKTFFNDGLKITVIGVLPPDFNFLTSKAQFFRPLSHEPALRQPDSRHNNNYQMIGRLRPGVTLADAQAEIDASNIQLTASDPLGDLVRNAGFHTTVFSLHSDHVRTVKPVLLLLQAGVLLLLLIGAVNLVNLLLIRASGRTKELAIRQALGAGRRHIVREVLVETLVLALVGGVLGLLLGAFGIELLATLGTGELPLGASITFDGRLAVLSLLATLFVGVLLALPVAWFNLRSTLAPSLQSETRGGTTTRSVQQLRHGFIIAQVALAFVLLSGAGLLGVSLKRLLDTPAGFNPDQLLTGQIVLPWKNYKDDAARSAFVERLLPALRTLPGVTHAAVNTGMPFTGGGANSVLAIEGVEQNNFRAHRLSAATAGFWAAMNIPLIEGRLLTDQDTASAPRVCVIDRALAQRYWPDQSALGRRVATGTQLKEDNTYTVVGVVGSVKHAELAETDGHGAAYFPYAYFSSNGFTVVLRTSLPPTALAPSLQKTILQLDPELPIDDLKTMQTRIDDSLIARRSPAILAAIFAGVALLLAAIGTYGALAYSVGQRRREIGVRMALGALPQQILSQFFRLGIKLLLVGLALGGIGAWLTGRAMQHVLFGVSALHAGILAATFATMTGVVLLAVLLPCRRASRVNPIDALRDD